MAVNIILALVLTAIIGGAVAYIYKEKKRGVVCVGCSHAGQCMKKAQGKSCGSHS